MANHYEVPSWAGKPTPGTHFDVMKDDKLIQKLMVDEKKCYLFGRNAQLNDFVTDHASCSRVHAAFTYHKILNIAYLVDLNSTHGTFIGNVRLEPHKPTQLQIGAAFHFGASTRRYILRERPSATRTNIMEDIPLSETAEGLLGLPDTGTMELDNLTEYNTAHNRRISMLGISDDAAFKKNKAKRKRKSVTFNEEEIIINPEDIDPSVGRFRNLVQSTVLPSANKRPKFNHFVSTTSSGGEAGGIKHYPLTTMSGGLYQGLSPPTSGEGGVKSDSDVPSISSKFLLLPNPAPDVTNDVITPAFSTKKSTAEEMRLMEMAADEPRKKKYAKEAWPGRKNAQFII